MLTSVVPQVIDALVSQIQTAAGGTPPTGAFWVFDGVAHTQDSSPYLVIGQETLYPDSESLAVDNTQKWAHAVNTGTDEEGRIHCCAVARPDGQYVMKTARDACYSILATVDQTLRTSTNNAWLNGAVPGLLWVKALSNGSLYYAEDNLGELVWMQFSIYYKARI